MDDKVQEYKQLKKQGLSDPKVAPKMGFKSVYALDRWKRKNKIQVGRANQHTVGGAIKNGK